MSHVDVNQFRRESRRTWLALGYAQCIGSFLISYCFIGMRPGLHFFRRWARHAGTQDTSMDSGRTTAIRYSATHEPRRNSTALSITSLRLLILFLGVGIGVVGSRYLELVAQLWAPSDRASIQASSANFGSARVLAGGARARIDPWLTSQLCHQLSDDSELCVYDGPVCYAGDRQLIMLSDALTLSGVRDADTRAVGCSDSRTWEAKDLCLFTDAGQPRGISLTNVVSRYFGGVGVDAPDAAAVPTLPTDNLGRIWGPTARGFEIGNVPPGILANITTPHALKHVRGGAQLAATLERARRGSLSAYSADVAQRVERGDEPDTAARAASSLFIQPPSAVTWVEGVRWYAFLTHNAFVHPWHFAAATMGVWGARRANASAARAQYSVPADGEPAAGDAPHFDFTVGGGATLPQLDKLVLATDRETPASFRTAETLPPWTRSILRLLLPRGATAELPGDRFAASLVRGGAGGSDADAVGPTKRHWHCSSGAVVLGEKPRLFTGVADAHAFRLAAYTAAGVSSTAAWPAYPPRTITLLLRKGSRGFVNADAVVAAAKATGLPVRTRVLERDEAAASNGFEAQVREFADTGVLIAAHGAALTNVAFMPVGAAVAEVFPFLGVVPIYRRLAEAARVTHIAIYSERPSVSAGKAPPATATGSDDDLSLFDDRAYIAACVAPAIPSGDGAAIHACDWPSKRARIVVSIARLRDALERALDDIGCRVTVDGRATRCRREGGGYDDFARPTGNSSWVGSDLSGTA